MNTAPVIVAGMHRSGTSAVARILSMLGVDLGPEDRLMPPKPDNPEGFWENLDLSHVNDDLLAQLGGRWDEPPPTHRWERAAVAGQFDDRAREILEGFDHEPIGFKDPRNSLLLPFWLRVLPDARVVVVTRNPRAVVESMVDRGGIDPTRAAALWFRYTFDALAGHSDPVVVDFDRLRADPLAQVAALANTLGLTEDPDVIAGAADSLQQKLASREAGPAPSSLVALAETLYDLLDELDHPTIVAIAAAIRGYDAVQRLAGVEERLDASLEASDEFERQRNELLALYRESRTELDEARAFADERGRALAIEEAARDDLSAAVRELRAELAAAGEELALRRQAQYRFERVLGKRGFRFLSGHRPSGEGE